MQVYAFDLMLMPSPNLIAAALTQRTKNIKIGIFGNLPALHANPVRLAEEVAMLDVMSGGRIISGFVRGVPQEFLPHQLALKNIRLFGEKVLPALRP